MSTITEVRIFKTDKEGVVKARANITLNGDFAVNGYRVLDTGNGLFVKPPTGPKYQKDGKDVYPEVAFPVTKELHDEIQKAILDKYNEA